jgi:apolipoprotein N-acyltransferase
MASEEGVFPLPPRVAYGAGVLSGLLYWLAFPGKLPLGSWHGLLSLIAFVPMWLGVQRQTPRRALIVGLLAGTTMNVAGFTWLLDMLEIFSGFPGYICIFFVLVVCTYQGGRIGLMGWLYARATQRGWPGWVVFVFAFVGSELVYPLLFPWYFAATAYQLPALSQTAELAGPVFVGAILVGANVALAEPLLARFETRKPSAVVMALPLAVLAAAIAFAAVRIPVVDREAQAGEPLHVGVVQGNLGLIQKREEPAEGLRRHLELTDGLKQKGVDLVVWSESSVTMSFPERSYGVMMKDLFTRMIGVPAIIGTVLFSDGGLEQSLYNTALSVDARGDVTGRYDKEFLLAFGEYLPFGELVPKLYEWSPNSGHFTPGTVVDPLPVTLAGMTHPVSVLICYEDILPSFTNKVVRHSHPELLVNMSNDAWFGDTAEPWEHLALAQLRAIEHRRYLVRSTNSGVSAIIDPVGRVMVHGGTFDAEALDSIVHWLHGGTLYETLGDTPMWIVTLLVFAFAFVRKDRILLAASVAASTLLLAACSSAGSPSSHAGRDASVGDTGVDSGVDAGAEADGPLDAGVCPVITAVDFGGVSCDTCVAAHCCSVGTRCYRPMDSGAAATCALLATCISDCAGQDSGVDACNGGCDKQYQEGHSSYVPLQECIAAKCTNEGGTGPCN